MWEKNFSFVPNAVEVIGKLLPFVRWSTRSPIVPFDRTKPLQLHATLLVLDSYWRIL